ncbi:unnamed protein product [Ixodes pacificus]
MPNLQNVADTQSRGRERVSDWCVFSVPFRVKNGSEVTTNDVTNARVLVVAILQRLTLQVMAKNTRVFRCSVAVVAASQLQAGEASVEAGEKRPAAEQVGSPPHPLP